MNRRSPNCTTVVQPAKDLSESEIQPNLPEKCQISDSRILKNFVAFSVKNKICVWKGKRQIKL